MPEAAAAAVFSAGLFGADAYLGALPPLPPTSSMMRSRPT
jgi:hypothetical protein